MTRRSWLFGLFATPLVAQILPEGNPHVNIKKLSNDFALEYNTWAMLRNENDKIAPGSVSWPAVKQWKEVRNKFHSLDVGVKNE